MVHAAAVTTRETLSGPARELMRRAAEQLLDPAATWAEDLHAAALSGELMRPITEDPVLAAGTRRANLSNLRHWAAATVADPGGRVPPNTGAEMLETSRDMVRRGLDARGLDAFRRGQDVAWRRWMDVCFGLTDDPQLLREVLEVSAVSVTAFVEDTLAAVMAQMAREHVELTHGASADRRATVTLLLEGAPIPLARAEARLGYGLSGAHTAAVVWAVGADARPAQVEAVAEAVARAAGVTRRLTVVASAASSWLWLPTDVLPRATDLAPALAAAPGVQVALGRPGRGVEGFRRSHLDAATTQRMLARPGVGQQLASYDDVQLAALLTGEGAQVEEFLTDTLGGLLHADEDTQATVLTYVRSLGSTTATAHALFTHRNTVLRRLSRADELLPRPLAEHAVAVAAALDLLRWRRP
ncbi:PucR C-terminal helix-turn-helix domain-containing protein [Klenkia terrae]|nr:PucR C-terminal helix-turn-helix domain-containing protein [Klenkia terrae]